MFRFRLPELLDGVVHQRALQLGISDQELATRALKAGLSAIGAVVPTQPVVDQSVKDGATVVKISVEAQRYRFIKKLAQAEGRSAKSTINGLIDLGLRSKGIDAVPIDGVINTRADAN
jgi:hypothetical protein